MSIIGKILIFILFATSAFAQKTVDHPFPRFFIFNFAGVSPPYVKLLPYNWIICKPGDSTLIRNFGVIDDNRVIYWTTDYNYGGILGAANIPIEWSMVDDGGFHLYPYSATTLNWADPTIYCGKYTGTFNATGSDALYPGESSFSITVNNETWIEATARYITLRTPSDVFDGLYSNGTWYTLGSQALIADLDKDGEADGSTVANNLFKNGQWRMRYVIDSTYFANKGKHLMSGLWTMGADTMCISNVNSFVSEGFMYNNYPKTWAAWESPPWHLFFDTSTIKTPRMNGAAVDMYIDGNNAVGSGHNNLPLMRGLLTGIQATSNFYVMFEYSGGGGHRYNAVPYDEYYTRLGDPAAQHQFQGVKLSGGTVDGVWVRFFEHGAMICNPTSTTKTVRVSDISGLSGYPGTLYRFKGNQDTTWNKGGEFDSVVIPTHLGSPIAKTIPNGIILRDSNLVIIAPIVVDNDKSATSAGSDTTIYTGTWTNAGANDYKSPSFYTSSINYHTLGYINARYVLGATSVTATATYRPKININGDYQVWETHGWKGTSASGNSTATPVKILHFGGSDSTIINQSINCGQWNYVGTYNFQKTSTNQIVVYNNNGQTSKYVIADAFKLVFVPPTYQSDAQKKVFFKNP